jgi:hypothetical protein
MLAPLHRFMVKHELPYTSWGLRWKSGTGEEPVQAQVYAIMQRGVTATLSVAIPPKHPWAQPVRIGDLIEEQINIKLMGKNWLGREKLKDFPLEKYFVTRVTRTSERHQLILSRKPKEQSDGLKITLREGDTKRVQIIRIDDEEAPVGTPATLEGEDAQVVKHLWRRIEETIADLVRHRHQLLAATLYGKRITDLDTPATIAVAMIQSIAPLVRDMKRHSRTPGELQLKRDLGDGRREELFISESEIVQKYQTLQPKSQQLFDFFGLTTTRVPSEEEVQRAEIMSAEQLHMSISGSNQARADFVPAAEPSEPMQVEITRPKVRHPMAEAPSSRGAAVRPLPAPPSDPPISYPVAPASSPASQPFPSYRGMFDAPSSQAPITQPPPTAPFPHVGPHSSDFAPPMSIPAQVSVPRAPRLPSSIPPPSLIPPPSGPPKRRKKPSDPNAQHAEGQVFRLPPPTSPPPKPVRKRRRGTSNLKVAAQ